MKSTTLLFLFLISSCLSAQNSLTKDQWRQDLEFLKETIHKDYSFLFKKTTADNFDRMVHDLDKKIPQLEEHEIIIGLAKIIASFKYGHTSIGVSGRYDNDIFQFHQLPIHLMEFKDGIFLQGVTRDYKSDIGAKVIAVNGVPINKVIEKVQTVFPVENYQFFKGFGLNLIGTPEVLHAQGIISQLDDSVEFELNKSGKNYTRVFKSLESKEYSEHYGHVFNNEHWVNARDESTTPLYLRHLDRIYFDHYLPEENTLYIRHSQIMNDENEDIATFYNRIYSFIDSAKVDRLIIDVRLNGGGNNFLNKPIITGAIKSRINEVGKFFVITGRRTFSACQNLINELDNYTNVIFVGEPSAENLNFYGDNNRVQLPNSEINVYLSYAWWQDKPQWRNADWTAPHLARYISFNEYINNEDPALQAALTFEDENFVKDPMGYITDLFQSGQMMKLQMDAHKFATDPNYAFFDFEGEFSTLALNLMGRGDTGTGMIIFQMLKGFYPDSPDLYFNLAKGQVMTNNIDGAKESLEHILEMDTAKEIKDKANQKLAEIED